MPMPTRRLYKVPLLQGDKTKLKLLKTLDRNWRVFGFMDTNTLHTGDLNMHFNVEIADAMRTRMRRSGGGLVSADTQAASESKKTLDPISVAAAAAAAALDDAPGQVADPISAAAAAAAAGLASEDSDEDEMQIADEDDDDDDENPMDVIARVSAAALPI